MASLLLLVCATVTLTGRAVWIKFLGHILLLSFSKVLRISGVSGTMCYGWLLHWDDKNWDEMGNDNELCIVELSAHDVLL